MRDFATSDNSAVQKQLDRLSGISLHNRKLGLDTIRALLEKLGNPQDRLPPVFHVAGTNGKGSTCAFLRAMLEAEGLKVHATTSPHLARYNERIRIAGKLIDDNTLADILAEVLDTSEGIGNSFFEVTIAATFLAFSRTPADACVLEVGLGGRLDATNVIKQPAVCGIATLGIDHERFLLAPEDGVPQDPLARIAFEKAGIAKRGVPLVTLGGKYSADARAAIADVAETVGAQLWEFGTDWHVTRGQADDAGGKRTGVIFRDRPDSELHTPPLSLPGSFQALNAGLAIAMLRRQTAVKVSEEAIKAGAAAATWPARLQRLSPSPIIGGREVYLDGGHNRNAGEALAAHFEGQRLHLIIGMIDGKDPQALVAPLAESVASLTAVPIEGQDFQPATAFGPNTVSAENVPAALAALPDDDLPVLIAGSLYLAGSVLKLTGELPD